MTTPAAAVSAGEADVVGDALVDAAVASAVVSAVDPAPPHAVRKSAAAVAATATPDDRRRRTELITSYTVAGQGLVQEGM